MPHRYQTGVESTLKYHDFIAGLAVNGAVCVSSSRRNRSRKGIDLDEFDKSETEGDWLFRELVGALMWLDSGVEESYLS